MIVNISVIICCYNSEYLLHDTLKHLANQKVSNSITYEVVLVDNNSSDDTSKVARCLWDSFKVSAQLCVVKEPTPGLSHARKRGVLDSKGNLIIFCDDDNWLDKNYLQTAYEFMTSNLQVGALGGQSFEVLECEEPKWWQKEKANYAVGQQAFKSGDVTNRGYVWGAGIVLRRGTLIGLYSANFISLLSDRKGEDLSSGGDSEFCKWVLLSGYKLWYLEELKFKHYITTTRLTSQYLVKLLEGHKQAQLILDLYNWFIFSEVYKQVNHYSIKKRIALLKKAIKGFINKNNIWKRDLQLAIGDSIMIHKNLYLIMKTNKRLNN